LPPRFPRSGLTEIDQLSAALRQMQQELADRFEALRGASAASSALVDAMVEGVLASDERGRIVTANPAARLLLGYDETGSMPNLESLFRVKAAREVVDATLRGEAVQDRELDLGGRLLLVNSRPLPTGGAVLVLHDVTELRRLEKVRRDFVANVSHELKTPLTSISGYAETLLSENPDEGTRRIFLRTILTNAQRIQSLVDDQLDLSRIESGETPPRLVRAPAASLVRGAVEPLRLQVEARGVTLDIDLPPDLPSVMADRAHTERVLANLVTNAARATERGGRITVSAAQRGEHVSITVADTGCGIPAEYVRRIFEPFVQVPGVPAGGAGLGLAISRRLVEAQGGQMTVQSEVGVGSSFTFSVPAAERAMEGKTAS
jgi:two-component system phosphate regulon sensor histidine kinase PhoR